ncbi:MAG: hypothetical protein WBO55_02335 [Rhizobiaceae bacterium]
MAILIVALCMTTAMMIAALRMQSVENRAELYRQLKSAGYGHFPEKSEFRN